MSCQSVLTFSTQSYRHLVFHKCSERSGVGLSPHAFDKNYTTSFSAAACTEFLFLTCYNDPLFCKRQRYHSLSPEEVDWSERSISASFPSPRLQTTALASIITPIITPLCRFAPARTLTSVIAHTVRKRKNRPPSPLRAFTSPNLYTPTTLPTLSQYNPRNPQILHQELQPIRSKLAAAQKSSIMVYKICRNPVRPLMSVRFSIQTNKRKTKDTCNCQ
jgi:hypothetical protein